MKLLAFSTVACFLAMPISAKKPLTLSQRYDKTACAVVQIVANGSMGTGFFISRSGDLATAAHVALNRKYAQLPNGSISLTIDYKPELRIVKNDVATSLSLPKLSQIDVDRAEVDLAVLKTGLDSPCFLSVETHRHDAQIGQRVIAIGFPLSAPRGALYEGFVSAQYKHLPTPVAVVNGIPLYPNYDVIRVQMPITPGSSGAPVIAEDGHVIGVVSENPTVWFMDLTNLIRFTQTTGGGFNAPVSDLPKMLGKLAWVVQQFVTSGSGLAVPTSYLWEQELKEDSPVKTRRSPLGFLRRRLGSRREDVPKK